MRGRAALVPVIAVMLLAGGVPSSASGPTWVSQGPDGGFINAVAVAPTDPTEVFAVTTDGLYRSTDGGAHWTLATPPNVSLGGIDAIAIDPSDANKVYVGSQGGEVAVYRSADGGATWTRTTTGLPGPGPFGSCVCVLAVAKSLGTTLYAAALGNDVGVYRSTDGGATWAATTLTDEDVSDIAVDPINADIVYAGTLIDGVFKTVNGGTDWNEMNNGLGGNYDITSLAIDPVDQQRIYAGDDAGNQLFVTADGGTTWNQMGSGLGFALVLDVAVDPSSHQTVYVSTFGDGVFRSTNSGGNWNPTGTGLTAAPIGSIDVTQDGSTLFAGSQGDGVFKSGNAGTSWAASNTGLRATSPFALAIDPVSNTIFLGDDGGLFKSTDGGTTWIESDHGLPEEFVRSIVLDPSNPNVMYAGVNFDGVYKSTNAGADWTQVSEGLVNRGGQFFATDGAELAVDPVATQTLYVGTNGQGVYKTTNGGQSWSPANNGPGLEDEQPTGIAIDPTNPQVVYVSTLFGQGIYKSTNGGGSWTQMNTGLPVTPRISALVMNPVNPAALLIGTDAGVYRSTDAAATWTQLPGPFGVASISALAADGTGQLLFVATSNGALYQSPNGGAGWVQINGDLPNAFITTLLVDPDPHLRLGTVGRGEYATQIPVTFGLTITVKGARRGKVVSTPAGITCGKACAAQFPGGGTVKLKAKPTKGSVFGGWAGACSGHKRTCTVSMTGDTSAKATFRRAPSR